MTDSTKPDYIAASPVGYHVTELLPFFRSTYRAPISKIPVKKEWATEKASQRISSMFPHTTIGIAHANLMIYNKSRDHDRICPACRRWYSVGEPIKLQNYASFEEFSQRPRPDSEEFVGEIDPETMPEQELSGICSQECMNVLTEGTAEWVGPEVEGVELCMATEAQKVELGYELFWKKKQPV